MLRCYVRMLETGIILRFLLFPIIPLVVSSVLAIKPILWTVICVLNPFYCVSIYIYVYITLLTLSSNRHYTIRIGLPAEAAAWTVLEVLNLKNNKVLDVGSLPQYWTDLARLYLGR